MNSGWEFPASFTDLIRLDPDRLGRRGFSESIYTPSKSPKQLGQIIDLIQENGQPTLFTRVDETNLTFLERGLPTGSWHEHARIFAFPGELPQISGGLVVILTAGGSDFDVASEVGVTAQYLGRRVSMITDIGVAGLDRLLSNLVAIREADVIVVVAGMDGALPGVVAGLVEAPVIAVPTSIGYGAAFGGLAALLTMLNACAPGVAIVNIDNGYGAGHLAAQITRSI
jgi:NCAIR mutase (PurE)-related protein